MSIDKKEYGSLSARMVLAIARAVAVKYDLKLPDAQEFYRQYDARIPMPLMTDNGNGVLWVDRYYVAYQLDGSRKVQYVYITRHHIQEEAASYRHAAAEKGNGVKLPGHIGRQFRSALLDMKASGVEVWVSDVEKLDL